jgi:hypothetical protein
MSLFLTYLSSGKRYLIKYLSPITEIGRFGYKSFKERGSKRDLQIQSPMNGVLPEKLKGPQLLSKFSNFMEPECSLPQSQKPTTCPYPEPDESSLCLIPLLEGPF